ncbi:MAG: RNA polymerase sigma factor [Fibrobacteres bacterium]|jgi:RNA polymerase sigma factor (sigma-70 family)|nr:RNA polymerase sigma factor [Fibrobacterota bacterium]
MASPTPVERTLAAVWRMESPRIIAAIARILGDVGLAEECAQEALLSALEKWPCEGLPDNPAAWLTTAAKHRALDRLRSEKLHHEKHLALGRELDEAADRAEADLDEALDDPIGDDMLRLIFTACHPVLSTEARTALTLRLVGGLATDEIARAFLVPEATMAQRIVRAKRALAEAKVPFEVPRGEDFATRLASVLEVIYLIFNEGYSATSGGDWMRPALCEDALRLGRVLQGLAPQESEVHGLAALMEIQASRTAARIGPKGEVIPLTEQNRAAWDRLLIQRGLDALARAENVGPGLGPYGLQGAIAACHARARTAAETDWALIASNYESLAKIAPSPVVDLNRAVALAYAYGPRIGLEAVERLSGEPALKGYYLLPAVRGDLLYKLGRFGDAAGEFARAADLTRNEKEQAFLRARAEACMWGKGPGSPDGAA